MAHMLPFTFYQQSGQTANDYARVQVPAVISCNQGDAYLATMELVEARFCTATTVARTHV